MTGLGRLLERKWDGYVQTVAATTDCRQEKSMQAGRKSAVDYVERPESCISNNVLEDIHATYSEYHKHRITEHRRSRMESLRVVANRHDG